ncbi:hypothetical protein ACU4GD_05065 [Cupriavidus basilensis]
MLSFAAIGAAHAATAKDLLPGDKYGYEFRTTVLADKYGYDFRTHDAFTGRCPQRQLDTFTEGARIAGLDRTGVSASGPRLRCLYRWRAHRQG